MSLDVSLERVEPIYETCPHCGGTGKVRTDDAFYSANITHNLNKMADAAGIYEALWRPEEIGITLAKDLIPLLQKGLETLQSDPEKFKAYDAPNGWGKYEHLVRFVSEYLKACLEYPDAAVKADR